MVATIAFATAVATVLGKHMHSVHVTMTTDAVDDDATPAGVVPFEHEAFGDGVVGLRASFDRGALESMMDLAVDSEDGVWTLRDWLNRYQADLAAVAVQRIAVGDITVARGVNTFLLEQMADAADLEGRWVEHVGHRAEHRGRDRDRELSFWIDAAGTAVSLGGSLFGGPLTSAVIGVAVDPVGDGFAALFADHQERARADAESLAADAAQQLTYSSLRELYDQGVVTPDLPPELVPGGELPDYATLQELLGQLRAAHPERTDLTVERILVAMDETTGRRGTNLDIRAVLAAVKVAQLDHYERLDWTATSGPARGADPDAPAVRTRRPGPGRRSRRGRAATPGGRARARRAPPGAAPLRPIGRLARQRISMATSSVRTYSAGQSDGP